MSRSVNKVTLIGNVGADPEVRTAQGGGKVATFSLATSTVWTNAAGAKQEATQWHRLVLWNTQRVQLADVAEKYVRKGDKLYVEGSIEYKQWQDRDGVTRYSTEIKVRELILLTDRRGDTPKATEERSAREQSRAKAAQQPASDNFDDFPGALQDEDDDLPF